jgi:hypothetical protein
MADATTSSTLARRRIRLAALAALAGDAFAGVDIESPGDWTTPPEGLPALILRAPDERKDSITKGMPEFTTVVTVEIEMRVGAIDAAGAQDAIEALCHAVEMALLTNYELIRMINQVAAIRTTTEISSDGKIHFAAALMALNFELPEMFDPFAQGDPPALTSFGLHFDAGAPFDASGTYANPAFPVNAAPRTSGPDGRDEGVLDILLDQ